MIWIGQHLTSDAISPMGRNIMPRSCKRLTSLKSSITLCVLQQTAWPTRRISGVERFTSRHTGDGRDFPHHAQIHMHVSQPYKKSERMAKSRPAKYIHGLLSPGFFPLALGTPSFGVLSVPNKPTRPAAPPDRPLRW